MYDVVAMKDWRSLKWTPIRMIQERISKKERVSSSTIFDVTVSMTWCQWNTRLPNVHHLNITTSKARFLVERWKAALTSWLPSLVSEITKDETKTRWKKGGGMQSSARLISHLPSCLLLYQNTQGVQGKGGRWEEAGQCLKLDVNVPN